MAERQNAMLTIQSNAARHLDKLDHKVRDRFADFQSKFCANMNQPGLRLKQLKTGRGLWSARIGDDYRAVMCKVGHAHFALIAVEARGSAYDRLDDRYEPVVNKVTGALEVMDHDDVRDAVTAASPVHAVSAKPKAASGGLFEPYTDAELLALGVAEPLMPSIRRIGTEGQLAAFCAVAPHHTAEVLRALDAGFTIEEVEELITAPVKASGPVDTSDLETAVGREASMVTSSDRAVAAMLESGFEAWRVWPHPTQKRVIDRVYKGPARVSGGPGTGKTVVALHRTARLARRLDSDERILLTTYTKNLAADLKAKLALLLDEEELRRVDVEHLDSVVYRLASESGRLGRPLDERELWQWWEELCREVGESELDAEFLRGEWTEVVCAQLITSRSEYFQARRVRRPRRLNRLQRARVWDLVERFNQRLAEGDAWCWPQLRASVALAEEHRVKGPYRYRHIVVDEAQDLTAAHWKLLRALAPEDTDDLFIAGDTFQRIYGQPVTLGKLGVDIRGRSKRLTLNYRTTREILKTALAIAADANADDLDGDRDSLAGYRSVMSGARPQFRPQTDLAAELAEIAGQVQAWTAEHAPGSIAVTVPTKAMVEKVVAALHGKGISARELARERTPGEDAVHVGTMHRLKGLEYRFMLISGIGADQFPFSYVKKLEESDPQRYELELEKARNLLFVAATRARDEVVFTWSGAPTRLLHFGG
ncbi:UvrD-helicase domain-containing protein [Glycomyces arizonensis]|uniref:UvrD-helicase domain-containing protein n=1 Tax=Glycomyces arizonensis TaxID=256035 RepID=UPI00040E313A|nr:UvrD-helicase domain-containing protein [Glycomyces arizonensis]